MKRIFVKCLLVTFLVITCLTGAALESEAMPLDNSSEQICQVTTLKGQLNVRSKPDARSKIIARLPNQSFVKVLKQENGFYQVELDDNQFGWVAAEFLTPSELGAEVLDYRPLQFGSKGEDVEALKKRLLDLGYYRQNQAMSDAFNTTCVIRVKLFQKLNGLEENGVASPMMQALLFSPQAKKNSEGIPAVKRAFPGGRMGKMQQEDEFDWDKFARENPGVCMCCLGEGCECCNFTGRIK